jgi:hypothetical protein
VPHGAIRSTEDMPHRRSSSTARPQIEALERGAPGRGIGMAAVPAGEWKMGVVLSAPSSRLLAAQPAGAKPPPGGASIMGHSAVLARRTVEIPRSRPHSAASDVEGGTRGCRGSQAAHGAAVLSCLGVAIPDGAAIENGCRNG